MPDPVSLLLFGALKVGAQVLQQHLNSEEGIRAKQQANKLGITVEELYRREAEQRDSDRREKDERNRQRGLERRARELNCSIEEIPRVEKEVERRKQLEQRWEQKRRREAAAEQEKARAAERRSKEAWIARESSNWNPDDS